MNDAASGPKRAAQTDAALAVHAADHAPEHAETQAVVLRYARRQSSNPQIGALDRYSALRPEVWHALQERQRALLRGLAAFAQMRDGSTLSAANPMASWSLVEVGCGDGGNLLDLLRWGFLPQHLLGLELLPERFDHARRVLPARTPLWLGDATQAPVAPASQDLVLQATVFSSLLDDQFQQQLARTMWSWLRPGGAVIWYDFTVNNPRNPDVRGVPMRRVKALFPQARIKSERLTLAPPLARALCRLHPALYPVFNRLPLLRTHVLAWLHKPL